MLGIIRNHLSRSSKYWKYGSHMGGINGARFVVQAELTSVLHRLNFFLPLSFPLISGDKGVTLKINNLYDLAVLEEIFFEQDYEFDYLPLPKKIVDIGANIGVSALYFSLRFPEAEVHCVEVNPMIVHRLLSNTRALPQIRVYPIAIAEKDGMVRLNVDGSRHASSSLVLRDHLSHSVQVPAWSYSTLVIHTGDAIDLLKFDVEGAETFIFQDADLSKVREMVGEVHLDLIGGSLEGFVSRFPAFELLEKRRTSESRFVVHMRNKDLKR